MCILFMLVCLVANNNCRAVGLLHLWMERRRILSSSRRPVTSSCPFDSTKYVYYRISYAQTLTSIQVSGTSTSSGLATSVDPKGYLTSLDSVQLKSDAEIGDIKRARMLFESLVKSNPKHAPGWIAAAALEEHAGRMVHARKLIKTGCEHCPKNEDIWLEAARLHVCSTPLISL